MYVTDGEDVATSQRKKRKVIIKSDFGKGVLSLMHFMRFQAVIL